VLGPEAYGPNTYGPDTYGPDTYGPDTYGNAFADVYDDWYADVSDVEGTVATIGALAGGGRVLELGIGTGRLALPLVAAGVEVHGVDASPAMVERLRAKPGGGTIPVAVADFSSALPAGEFAVVFVAFNTLLNLTAPGAVERCFALVAGALAPGGAFVVEAFVPAEEAVDRGVDVRQVDPDEVVLSVFATRGEVVHGSLVSFTEAGGVRLRPWAIRPLGPEALDAIAQGAGFELARRNGGWQGEPFDDGADRHVTVYRLAGSTFGAVIGP
jgi:SAM-dependent methyltransferase